ncbi:hypothetical protein [Bartonella raoultii]|uniref:Uncharacterized protein n=1 Tax=Bartonella raoultii TaxID=1457020 RepID=A0ABS7I8V4_9HYPH|nr:hypothetical protein [Bartonella raoultii]MBX4336024.1 hypothetical protein [Bartonella raoultii]
MLESLCIGVLITFFLLMLCQAIYALKKAKKQRKEIVAYCAVLFLPMFVPWLPLIIIFNSNLESDLQDKVGALFLAISGVSLCMTCLIIKSLREDGLQSNIADIAFMTCGVPLLICGLIGGIIALFMWNITIGIIIIGLLVLISIREYLLGICGVILGLILTIALIKFIWRIV